MSASIHRLPTKPRAISDPAASRGVDINERAHAEYRERARLLNEPLEGPIMEPGERSTALIAIAVSTFVVVFFAAQLVRVLL